MDFDFVEINWSLSLHWLKAAEHYRVDSEGSAGMTVGWPPVRCGWVSEACYLHPWLLWEPVLGGRLLGQGTPPHLPILGLYLLFRSALPPCLVLWGVALSRWGELNLHCVLFSPPAPYIYSYSCASPKSELSHPQSYSTAPVRMASEAPEKGVVLYPAGRKGRLGWQVHFAQLVWGQGDVTAQPGAGQEMVHAKPWEVGAQAQTLGKGPGNLSLKVAFLVVSVCRAEGLVLFFNLFCRAAWNLQGCSRPSGAQELCFGKCLESGWLCGLPMGPCSHRTVSCMCVFANCHKSRLLWTSGGLKPALY